MKIMENFSSNVDIFYSNRDVTSLRWLSEIRNEITRFRTSIVFRIHELSSEYAKSMKIFSELITFNNKTITFEELRKVIKNHLLDNLSTITSQDLAQ